MGFTRTKKTKDYILNMTKSEFKKVLPDKGFKYTSLGVWVLGELEVVYFVLGKFWINKGLSRLFTGNYKNLTTDELDNIINNILT